MTACAEPSFVFRVILPVLPDVFSLLSAVIVISLLPSPLEGDTCSHDSDETALHPVLDVTLPLTDDATELNVMFDG